MSSQSRASKTSGFASFFGRKKLLNGTKGPPDDMKSAPGPHFSTAQAKHYNRFIDSNPVDIDAALFKDLQSFVGPSSQNRITDFSNGPCNHSLSNTNPRNKKEQRTAKFLNSSKGTRSESVPLQISTLPDRTRAEKSGNQRMGLQDKSQSANAVYFAIKDSGYLMEALETLADEQPLVARSIPKHAVVDTSHFAEHSLDNCIFDSSVYETMLDDSLKTCQLLQDHLNDCAAYVRARSPSGAEVVDNFRARQNDPEMTSLDSDENASQQTILLSPYRDPDRLSASTSETRRSSTNSSRSFGPDTSLTTRLQSTVQYHC